MLRPLVRSLVSAFAAACFSMGAVAGSGMPECAATGHGHATHHGDPGRTVPPAGGHTHCVVHLCCVDMAPEPPVALGDVPPGAASQEVGFAPTAAVPAGRPDHSLPFAHAPPRPTA
jgi:hypothetical protein